MGLPDDPEHVGGRMLFTAELQHSRQLNLVTCRVGGAEAPPLFKPDERISRIRLSREQSVQGIRESSVFQGPPLALG